MVIDGHCVALPDLDGSAGHGPQFVIDDSAEEEDRRAPGQNPVTFDDEQIGIGRARPLAGIARIKRSEHLCR
jgi:hypothetical protein